MDILVQQLGVIVNYIAVAFGIVTTGLIKRFWLYDKATQTWAYNKGDFASLVLPVLPIILASAYALFEALVFKKISWQTGLASGIVAGFIAGHTWKIGRSMLDSIFLGKE